MKHLLFIGILLLSMNATASGQCVIYSDDNTGAFGAGFNNDNAPTTFRECKDEALKQCRNHGGQDCEVLLQGSSGGWWAIISGRKSDGRVYFQGCDGYKTK